MPFIPKERPPSCDTAHSVHIGLRTTWCCSTPHLFNFKKIVFNVSIVLLFCFGQSIILKKCYNGKRKDNETSWQILASQSCADFAWVQLYSTETVSWRRSPAPTMSTRSQCISGSRGGRSSLTTWPALTQAWRHAIALLWSRWSPWWGEEKEEEEKIRWRAGRKHRPRWASCTGAIQPWNIPLTRMDNVVTGQQTTALLAQRS